MRAVFSNTIRDLAAREDFIFLTGDLGFMALEGVRAAMGRRFINAGVAEQNMVSMAAGLARSGLRPWVYSIAPFVYARPFEQIRNDVCLHRLPVVLVGNGGGYGYGVQGATHHAIEDYGALLTLGGMRAMVPAFDEDLPAICAGLMSTPTPAYLRLGLSEKPSGAAAPAYAPWRRLVRGTRATVAVTGSIAGGLWAAVQDMAESERPSIWLVSEFPIVEPPAEFIADMRGSEHLVVVEEHVAHGGLAMMLSLALLERGQAPRRFTPLCAKGYVSGTYGSQKFHRKECGLAAEQVLEAIGSKAGS